LLHPLTRFCVSSWVHFFLGRFSGWCGISRISSFSSLCGVPCEFPFRVTVAVGFPSNRSGLELSFERRSSLVSSRKGHAWRVRRSEGGRASDTLRCLTGVETGDEVVSEFEVEGMGEGVDVDVVMARVWAVADVDTFEEEDGTAKGFEKEKVEEEDGMSNGRNEIESGKA